MEWKSTNALNCKTLTKYLRSIDRKYGMTQKSIRFAVSMCKMNWVHAIQFHRRWNRIKEDFLQMQSIYVKHLLIRFIKINSFRRESKTDSNLYYFLKFILRRPRNRRKIPIEFASHSYFVAIECLRIPIYIDFLCNANTWT